MARGLLKCPVCNTGLEAKPLGRIEVMHCPSCGGYWVQRNKLGSLLRLYMGFLAERHDRAPGRRKRVNPWQVETVRLVCPECSRVMTKLNYAYNSNVIVDMCDTCKGVWLDRGEIEKIAAFLKYCGLPEKVKKELAEIKAIYDRHGEGGEDVRDDLDDLGDMILSIVDTWDF